jgi:hypothetical protein
MYIDGRLSWLLIVVACGYLLGKVLALVWLMWFQPTVSTWLYRRRARKEAMRNISGALGSTLLGHSKKYKKLLSGD